MRSPTALHKRLFGELLDVDPAERDAAIVRLADGDRELEQRLRGLLAAHEKAESVLGALDAGAPLEMPATDPFEVDALAEGDRIGPYELRRELGSGGFGRVWLAEQLEPVRRPVALKLLKAGMDTREVVARFQGERQALARMEHPGIAKVYDAGETERGRPWFAMEYVDGATITSYCDDHHLDLVARLELFAQVCRAVQHAHTKGVVHRDIKPNNVMVTEVDGRPRPKVIDFGVAKALEEPLIEGSHRTRVEQWMGTPAYMAPEQVSIGADVDTRADVYSLGALLHTLLVGEPPFEGDPRRDPAWVDRVTTERPPRPSTRLGAGAPPERPGVTKQTVRRELDWIIGRCLEKDPDRRYDSAAVLANEVLRVVAGEPVLAGPPGLGYRFATFVRRNRVTLAVAASVFVLLLAGLLFALDREQRALDAEGVASRNAEQARLAEQEARAELERASAVALLTEHMLLSVKPSVAQGADTALMVEMLERAEEYILEERDHAPLTEAELARLIGGAWWELGESQRSLPLLRRSLELRRRELGDDAPETLRSIHDLGTQLLQLGDLKEAEPLLTENYEAYAGVDLATSEPARDAAMSYAALLDKLERPEEALAIRRRQVAALETILEPGDADLLRARNNLASSREDVGEPEAALAIWREVLARQLADPNLGPAHPHSMMTRGNIAGVLRTLGRKEEARDLAEETLEAKRSVLPEGHISLLTSINNLGELEKQLGNLERAEVLYREALELARTHLGAASEPARIISFNLAGVCMKRDRYDEAIEQLEPAAASGREKSGPTTLTLFTENSLALAYLHAGRFEEAEEAARRATADARERFAPESGDAARYAILHGHTLVALERYDEAEPLLVESFRELEDLDRHADIRQDAAEALARIHEAAGDAERAAEWRARAAALAADASD